MAMNAIWTGTALSSTDQPPIVTITTRPALTSRSTITVARVACTTGLSRLGCVTMTPGFRCERWVAAIARMTIHPQPPLRRLSAEFQRLHTNSPAGVVEPVDTLALGASGREPLGVRVSPPACSPNPGLSARSYAYNPGAG